MPGEPLALPQPLAEPDPDAPASSSASAAAGLKAQASVPQPHPPPPVGPKRQPLLPPAPCLLSPVPLGCWCGWSAAPPPRARAWASLLATSTSAGLARLSPSVCARHACLPLPQGTGQPTGAQSAWHMKELTTFPSYPVPFFCTYDSGQSPLSPSSRALSPPYHSISVTGMQPRVG